MDVQLCADGWTVVTGRRTTEAQLRGALTELTLRLREAHHRCRNQLQTVLGVVRRRAGELPWFGAVEATVAALRALHDHLGEGTDPRTRIDSAAYLRRLRALVPPFADGPVDLAAGVDLAPDDAARLGMILVQLVSGGAAQSLRSTDAGDGFVVEVAGPPPAAPDLELCRGLAAQIGASFTASTGPPFVATVAWPR